MKDMSEGEMIFLPCPKKSLMTSLNMWEKTSRLKLELLRYLRKAIFYQILVKKLLFLTFKLKF